MFRFVEFSSEFSDYLLLSKKEKCLLNSQAFFFSKIFVTAYLLSQRNRLTLTTEIISYIQKQSIIFDFGSHVLDLSLQNAVGRFYRNFQGNLIAPQNLYGIDAIIQS
jgi:hypothetical protein